ncbi:phospholipase D-like domain-containing protein [Halobellus sp. H-GB7]|uniref:phospholipase D-like domain-containing protein n=1 Tax=Halobellus sp. H-GB7 TaxID=3069756 RepID=UPI0027B82C2E|nr:phospholipase D-like domain-containing protein [Halobellus sp. H-GB7]MDQ2053472.1 phospholipase D-like domain-containing protein [Halobellus sp. H-GB7]
MVSRARRTGIAGRYVAANRTTVQRPASREAYRLVCVLLLVAAGIAGAVAPVAAASSGAGPSSPATNTTDGQPAGPHIVATFPDPVANGDVGEFVVVDAASASNLTLSDGESNISVPSTGTVALSAAPNATRALVDVPVVRASLSLANAGERLVLRRDGVAVDRVIYDRAREGERLNATTGQWTPRGLSPRPVVATGPATATAFVLPDSPDVPLETLQRAETRVLLAGYTFASPRVADALLAAADRGVRVRVLLEGGPVGGTTTNQREQLDRLVAGGVDVRVIDGPHARFSYHHPKYAVSDDDALVLTENWKPAGTGGRDSRGWGVRVHSERTADELAAVFAHDADGIDAVPWREHRRNASFVEEEPASGSYDAGFAPETVTIEHVRVLTAPGNAGAAVRSEIAGAEARIAVLSPRLDPDGPYFASLVAAAERGVDVRILLSNAWYDEESNQEVVERTMRLRERGLPIEARIARPAGRFGKVHAKGAVIDGETVVVGSLNWNEHAATENREVTLALDGEAAATYYGRVFTADWDAAGTGGSSGERTSSREGMQNRKRTLTMALGALSAASLAGFVLRRTVDFE